MPTSTVWMMTVFLMILIMSSFTALAQWICCRGFLGCGTRYNSCCNPASSDTWSTDNWVGRSLCENAADRFHRPLRICARSARCSRASLCDLRSIWAARRSLCSHVYALKCKKLHVHNLGASLPSVLIKMEILKSLLLPAGDHNLTKLKCAKLLRGRRDDRSYLY